MTVWPLVRGRRSLLAFATFAFAIRFRIRSSRGLGNLRFPSCLHWAVFHHVTVHATPETVAFELLSLASLVFLLAAFLASLGLGKGVDIHGRRSSPMHVRLHEHLDRQSLFLRGIYGRSLHSKVIMEDFRTDFLDAHHVYRFQDVLHIIAKSLANHLQLLLESFHACNHVRIINLRRREQHLQQLYISQWVERMVLVIQSSPCMEPHFSLGVAHSCEILNTLFHERNQINGKLHVEICHVSPLLPRSNLLDVGLRNWLIVSVLSPIQDRKCLTETPRSLNTKPVPPIRPSFLITLELFYFGKRLESYGYCKLFWQLAQRQDW